jgi:hypothetical protein
MVAASTRSSLTAVGVSEDVVRGLGPGEGVPAVVPVLDEPFDGGDEFFDVGEVPRRIAWR